MKKVAYALLSVVIAIGLWVYVITTVNPEWEETYYNIPVVLENENALHGKGLMIAVDEAPKVTLKLLGNRSDLANLSSANITLVADLSKIYDSGEQRISYDISYPPSIPKNKIEVVSQTPQEITLTISERSSKEVPVVPVYEGAVPDGYLTDKENLVLDYQYINITGPASVINQIESARIQVNLENQTETINQTYRYTLCNKKGEPVDSEQVITDVTEVKLNLKIQRYKEISLKLDIIPGGGATVKNTLIEMDMKTIQVSGSEQQLSKVSDLKYEIRLGDIAQDTIKEFKIKLPEGVENLTGKDTLNVSIKFPGLVTRTITVSNIVPKNVPKGMKAEVIAKEMAVVIRGPKAQVEAMSSENLTVHVDFTEAVPGQDTYKALVYVDAGTFGDVGAVGSYSVYANVEKVEEESES